MPKKVPKKVPAAKQKARDLAERKRKDKYKKATRDAEKREKQSVEKAEKSKKDKEAKKKAEASKKTSRRGVVKEVPKTKPHNPMPNKAVLKQRLDAVASNLNKFPDEYGDVTKTRIEQLRKSATRPLLEYELVIYDATFYEGNWVLPEDAPHSDGPYRVVKFG